MRIRRAALCYVRFENFTYDIHKEPHPLKKFISFKIEDSSIIIDGKKESLKVNEEVFFYKNNSTVMTAQYIRMPDDVDI